LAISYKPTAAKFVKFVIEVADLYRAR